MAAKSTHLAPLGHDLSGIHVRSKVNTTPDAFSRMAEHGQMPLELQPSRRELLGPRGAKRGHTGICVKKEENAGRTRARLCST